ncbi:MULTISPECIES: ComF family protein [Ramlibacter]|uniref:ComF family protein n=1 Tax=Ramlibacter aquaticus TaxID=2780094 RepID=A0ABR9SDB1_9BURK|nr:MULTISPECIES: ComF family protein [Ramlibacter]MBE7940280.1 ComF family protein [Ramlibacter aquaticus]
MRPRLPSAAKALVALGAGAGRAGAAARAVLAALPGPWALPPVPARCAVCGAWPAQPVCEACVARFAQPRLRCRTCALPVAAGVVRCGGCLREDPVLARCHAAVDYGYPWRGIVAEFKFRGWPGWAASLALLMRSAPWVEPALEEADWVLPMPLAPGRLAQRGFNQSLLLARRLAPRKADPGLLLRLRETAPQAALARAERAANVRGAFAAEPLRAAQLRGRRIVLVDDVMTSGASMSAAATALREAGALAVDGLVFARTPQPL